MSDNSKTLAHIIGNLGKDPERKFIESIDKEVVNLSVGVSMSYGDDGITRWVSVGVWNKGLMDQVMKNLKKGSKVAVEGTMKVESWEGKPQYKMTASRIGPWAPFERVKDESYARADKPAAQEEALTW